MRMPIYVLTLENRRDRQEVVTTSLQEVGVSFQFIFSSKGDNQNFNAMPKTSQIEVAIWSSHVRALHEMLQTDSQWGLILEDDFTLKAPAVDLFKNQKTIDFILKSLTDQYSILQIGFLENSHSSKLSRIFGQIFKAIFRQNRFDLRSYLNNFRYLRIRETNKINKVLMDCGFKKTKLLYGLRLGSHAYFINRKTALSLIEIFENRYSIPNFMTIDQYLLSQTKNFQKDSLLCAARLSNSLVSQSTSPSDNVGKTSVKVLERSLKNL